MGALCVAAPSSTKMGQPDSSSLSRAMEAALAEEGLVGAVWALVTPTTVVTGAAGLANARTAEPMSAEHLVQVGSVVKTLIAAGVLRLASEKKLALDAPIALLLPDLTIDNPWNRTDPILLRHLLDHTSGLDDARLWQVFSLESRPDTPLRRGIPSRLRVRFQPGARLSYSNTGYTLLGMVIEAVTGERYEPYLDARLLGPLGMAHSTFRFTTQSDAPTDQRLAMGHFENGVTHPAVPSYVRPAGQFTTTAADMARFARFLMGDGRIGGEVFIDGDLLRAMGRPSTTEAAKAGLEAGYGLGLNRRDRHGVVGRCHSGNTVGYRAAFCLYPAERKAYFLAINADDENADYGRLDGLLIRALGVAPVVPAPPAQPPPDFADWRGIYVPTPNRLETFAYLDRVLNFATVHWDGARLRFAPLQAAAKELSPLGGALLRSHDRATASHVVLTSADGRRAITDGFQTYQRVSRWRIAPLWLSLAAGVAGLAYLFLAGMGRAAGRRLRASEPIFVPFLGALALALPIPLFFGQSFLRLGDLTPASATLAVATGALPFAMIVGLWRTARTRPRPRRVALDSLAMVAVLQWTIVLAFSGLVPLRLWA